jgi:hypothetical protein
MLCLATAAPLASVAQSATAAQAGPRRVDAASVIELPFDLVGGLIVLRNLPLNEKRGDFILDTGSEFGLVVDSAPFAGQLRPSRYARARGATGTNALQELPVSTFGLGAARYTGFAAQAAPLGHLRRYVGPKLLGFIGYELLRDYEVVVDYPRRRATFYTLRTSKPTRRPYVRQDSVAFKLVKGTPVAACRIGAAPVRLLLDTGAVTDQLDAAFCQTLAPASRPTLRGTEPITGGDGHQQLARVGQLPSLVVGTTEWQKFPIRVFPFAQPASRRALAYQGVLGHPFLLQQQVLSFHYGRQQLYFLAPITK